MIITDSNVRRFAKTVVYFLAGIGIVMVIRRTLVLNGVLAALNRPGKISPDQGFVNHPFITLLHIVPGALFMILGPLQFVPRIRTDYIKFHRWSGRVFVISAYVIGFTSIMLPFVKTPIGGITEAAASVFFAIIFLICLSISWFYILRKQTALHRQWIIRTFSIGLAISTVRLIAVSAFALFKIPPQNFIGTAFWIGFTLHLIGAEVWLTHTRKPLVPSNRIVY